MSSRGRWVTGVTVMVAACGIAATARAQSPRWDERDAGGYACEPSRERDAEREACGAEPERSADDCGAARGAPARGARDRGCDAAPPEAVWGRDGDDPAPRCELDASPPPRRSAPSPRRACEHEAHPSSAAVERGDAERALEPERPEAPRYALHTEPLSDGMLYGAVPLLIGGALGLIGGAVTVAKADSRTCDADPSLPECDPSDTAVGAAVLGASSTAILVGVALAAVGSVEVQIVEQTGAAAAAPAIALRGTGAELTWAF